MRRVSIWMMCTWAHVSVYMSHVSIHIQQRYIIYNSHISLSHVSIHKQQRYIRTWLWSAQTWLRVQARVKFVNTSVMSLCAMSHVSVYIRQRVRRVQARVLLISSRVSVYIGHLSVYNNSCLYIIIYMVYILRHVSIYVSRVFIRIWQRVRRVQATPTLNCMNICTHTHINK